MRKKLLIWFVVLLCCFVVSTFAHEMAHGISSEAFGIHVSTGFNKIGMPYKSPSNPDFRTGFSDQNNPWDMGPTLTLVLAVVFTAVLVNTKSRNQKLLTVIGAFALCNSLIRLIPMAHSYIGYITQGGPYNEDEIGNGLAWYALCPAEIMKYLPSIISIGVSLVCLYFVIKAFGNKFEDVFSSRRSTGRFVLIVALAFIASFAIEFVLDNAVRINWI
jgi:hypothetical protein